jgi:hypothetical protein
MSGKLHSRNETLTDGSARILMPADAGGSSIFTHTIERGRKGRICKLTAASRNKTGVLIRSAEVAQSGWRVRTESRATC